MGLQGGYRRGGGYRGFVPFKLWCGGMIVLSQTVGTSAPNPVQTRLKITRGTTAQHDIQWRKKRGQKQTQREKKQWTDTTELILKESHVRLLKSHARLRAKT